MKFRMYMIAQVALIVGLVLPAEFVSAQVAKSAAPSDLQRLADAAKTDGKLVISIPPSGEFRKALEDNFGKRFGISLELVPARGATLITRMVDEAKAGVAYFDLHIGGTESAVRGLLSEGILDPVDPWIVLPEAKDARNWWGGHIWMDNAKRFIYSFAAYQTESLWHNANLVKPDEVLSFDDLLNPKWQGKIGFSDPRTPGSGASMWSYIRSIKGEGFLKSLVGQKMFISRDLRVLAESTAREKIAIAVGLIYADFAPFLKAGMPIKPLPQPKEGMYATTGYGNLMVLKNALHANAARLFINWFLSKDGQEVYTQGMAEPSRRLDVDAAALKKTGISAAKDIMSIEEFHKRENQSEEKVYKVRAPGADLARKLLD
ncbi:MAG: extracellular solute-binding protein [Deltaproteobacteria bacterium]|nr:extracellular solute-binding protein [Deltaproteobacteria bacterium]